MDKGAEKLVTAFETSNEAVFVVARSLLDSEGIWYRTKNENLRLTYESTTGILVHKRDLRAAKKVLKDVGKDSNENIFLAGKEVKASDDKEKGEFNYFTTMLAISFIIVAVLFAIGVIRC